MFAGVFRFTFDESVPIEEAEMTLHLAIFAAEGLFGKPRVAMEFHYDIQPFDNFIDVHGETEVGVAVAQVFGGLLLREFGESAFRITNLPSYDSFSHEVAA
ncbi:hypothetical protein VN12_24040 [Pirellula sp. SH-Sr6A]|uniref:hypothetical protein n=1 Tax=Pirellula sp. SH-Sr6A TaxID=1632865 RepID=UPI00078ED2E8|nr:hypothetical protein [Pirellula sp. SH-Sr6A]AMV35217.1 hypothetical protein VN12_24040 [Pirellula sp. SH-Sr6A]